LKEYELLGSYTFSGKYPIPIPREQVKRARVLYADINLLRAPKSPYFDNKTSKPNGFLGTILAVDDQQVLQRYNIEYERVRIYLQGCFDDQTMYALRCYANIAALNLQIFAEQLGVNLNLVPNEFSNNLQALHIFPTELLFKAYAGAAFKVDLYRLNVLTCEGEGDALPPDPAVPPVPEVPERVPSGEPIPRELLTPPPEGTNPEDYEPFPIDPEPIGPGEIPVEPPFGEDCTVYRVNLDVLLTGFEDTLPFSGEFFGPIGGVRIRQTGATPSENEVEVFSRGNAGLGGQGCVEPDWYAGIVANNIEAIAISLIEEV